MSADPANSRSPTVAIPRVLWWFRLWPFWKAFFENLGCRVATNDPTRPTPSRHDRASTIVEEACFPIQLLIDRTLAIADGADAVFMPRLISVVPRGIMCPRFIGVPDIVRIVLEQGGKWEVGGGRREAGAERKEEKTGKRTTSCAPIPPPTSRVSPLMMTGCQPILLAPVIDARLGRAEVRKAYLKTATALGFSAKAARSAFRDAAAVQERFEADFERRLNHLPARDVFDLEKPVASEKTDARPFRVAVLGHPYVVYDWECSLGVIEKLRSLGAWVVPAESVARKQIKSSVRKLGKTVYWSSGREVLGAALSFFEKGGIEGVLYLSCFKCGVDGLLTDVVRWAARHQSKVGYLSLTLDGHDNEMGLMTRLEAFVDIVCRRAASRTKFL